MKLPNFLRLPKIHRRKRSRARSDIGPIEGQSEPDPTAPRPTESTPDLRTGTLLLSMPGSSPPDDHDQVSHQYGERIFRRVSPSQICCGGSLGHPESLRGTVRLSQTMPPMILTANLANNGVSPDDRIVDTPS